MGKKQFSNSVSISSTSSVLNNSAISTKLTVSTTEIELKVGATSMIGRKAIYIEADQDNSSSIYIGVGNITLSDTTSMMRLSAGDARQIDIDGNTIVILKAKSISGTNYLRITEMK